MMVITDMVTNWSVQKRSVSFITDFSLLAPLLVMEGNLQPMNVVQSFPAKTQFCFFFFFCVTAQSRWYTNHGSNPHHHHHTHPPPSSLSRSLKDAVLYEAWKGLSEKERESNFFYLYCSPWKAFSSDVYPYWICWWGPWPCQGLQW